MLSTLLLPLLAFFAGSQARSTGPHALQPLHAPQPRQQPASCEHSATSRRCWGQYSIDTDWHDVTPNTGVTREYWLVAEKKTINVDGYDVEGAYVFNGSMPGPKIEADWGDELIIHVTNLIPERGTSVHWHGIWQRGTNNADGVPGVTQCPIAPNETMTYRFRATNYGTGWYHAHMPLQFGLGLLGPMIINGPATADYDVDVGPIIMQEWFHRDVWEIWEKTQRVVALIQPAAENGLINGRNPYDCSKVKSDPKCVGGGKTRFVAQFEGGKKYRFRVIGAQTDSWMRFSIDGHKLKVIAMDFVPVKPYETDSIVLASGQRYDVVVEADQPVQNYWLRAIYLTGCNQNNNDNKDNILGIVRYAGANQIAFPTTTRHKSITNDCGDEDQKALVPWVAHTVGAEDERKTLALSWYYELNTVFHWTLNTKTLRVDWSNPTSLDIYARGSAVSFPRESNVIEVESLGKWVYWVIQDVGLVNAYHPFHLHGHDFYVLAQGRGPFVPGLVKLNTNNPPRRDTATLYGNGYTVVAFKTDNPGSWLMHCHIAWHASQGLALQLIENRPAIPAIVEQNVAALKDTCSAWKTFYALPDTHQQDDSGI